MKLIDTCYSLLKLLIISLLIAQLALSGRHDDEEYLYEMYDEMVEIDNESQYLAIQSVRLSCNTTLKNPNNCPQFFDGVMCWPETPVNTILRRKCPNYIHKFFFKKNVTKSCAIVNDTVVWFKANYSLCRPIDPPDPKKWEDISNELDNIFVVRIIGYVVSMTTLIFSIAIMLCIKKLRCERNYVHINTFFAFALRTVITLITTEIIESIKIRSRSDKAFNPKINDINMSSLVFCRVFVFSFRYSTSTFHVAIFAEALYLFLLLRYPFYSEKRGFKFCIFLTWVLPLAWMIPWLIARLTIPSDNNWCWHNESQVNLILKIPKTILVLINLLCGAFIIKTLYSKLHARGVSREKVMKYRRLAKSILILIPIFGTYFLIFNWHSYAKLSIELTMDFALVESIFNAFQGFLVSITCCFIQKDVRTEIRRFFYRLVSSPKCQHIFPCCKKLAPDSVTSTTLSTRFSTTRSSFSRQRSGPSVSASEDCHSLVGSTSSIKNGRRNSRVCFSTLFDCLCDPHKRNDFHQTSLHRSKIFASKHSFQSFNESEYRKRSQSSSTETLTNESKKSCFRSSNKKLKILKTATTNNKSDQIDNQTQQLDHCPKVKFTLYTSEPSEATTNENSRRMSLKQMIIKKSSIKKAKRNDSKSSNTDNSTSSTELVKPFTVDAIDKFIDESDTNDEN